MPSKNILAVAMVALALGSMPLLAFETVEAISPTVEELADLIVALQVIIDDYEVRITANLGNIVDLSQQLAALPVITISSLTDTNNPVCDTIASFLPVPEWCPDDLHIFFDITDIEIEENSFVVVSVDDDSDRTVRCYVNSIDEDLVQILCQPAPSNGAVLHYIIVE